MAAKHTHKLSPEALAVLAGATADGKVIRLPEGKLPIPMPIFQEIKKVMGAIAGKWHTPSKGFLLDKDASLPLLTLLGNGEVTDQKKVLQAYYTSDAIADEIAELASVKGHAVLEPSAGAGALARACMRKGAERVDCVEINPEAFDGLVQQGFMTVQADFLALLPGPGSRYSRVVMNPPFCAKKGLGKQDVAHIRHARDKWLGPTGFITSVVPGRGEQSRPDLFESDLKAQLVHQWPEGHFRESGTMIANMLIRVYQQQ